MSSVLCQFFLRERTRQAMSICVCVLNYNNSKVGA